MRRFGIGIRRKRTRQDDERLENNGKSYIKLNLMQRQGMERIVRGEDNGGVRAAVAREGSSV